MHAIRRFADDEKAGSLSDRMRARRFRFFESLTENLPKPLRIIDVGGTSRFWAQRGCGNNNDYEITTVNLTQEPQDYSNIRSVVGDATRLEDFDSKSFDIAFSNSVIEHLFTLENQKAMAREVQRVGKAFWVQTPNFWFPIEPHFHFPGWQWMPIEVRTAILRRRTCGWRGRTPDKERARRLVSEVRLMTYNELHDLFPNARIVPERFAGFTKSWIVIGGFLTSNT